MTADPSMASAQAIRSHGQEIVMAAHTALLVPDLMRYCSKMHLEEKEAEKKEEEEEWRRSRKRRRRKGRQKRWRRKRGRRQR